MITAATLLIALNNLKQETNKNILQTHTPQNKKKKLHNSGKLSLTLSHSVDLSFTDLFMFLQQDFISSKRQPQQF